LTWEAAVSFIHFFLDEHLPVIRHELFHFLVKKVKPLHHFCLWMEMHAYAQYAYWTDDAWVPILSLPHPRPLDNNCAVHNLGYLNWHLLTDHRPAVQRCFIVTLLLGTEAVLSEESNIRYLWFHERSNHQ
jgi:hypothetical protein